MSDPREEVAKVAAGFGWAISDSEVDDYVEILRKVREAFEAVEAMDGWYLR